MWQLGCTREAARLLLRARSSAPAKHDVTFAARVAAPFPISKGLQRNAVRVKLWNWPRSSADALTLARFNVADALRHHNGVLRVVGEDVDAVQREPERSFVKQEVIREGRHD